MKAVIMAGGDGKRLRPLTCSIPKPMLPVANRPVAEYAIDLLKKHGIHEIGLTLRYLPNEIISHFGSGKAYDAAFEYFTEKYPLGTAGSVKNAIDFLSDTFVVLSGDGLTDIDITKVINYHKQKNADVTIVLKRVKDPLEYGVVITKEDGRIINFIEKPLWNEVFSDSVNTGIYIINKNVMELVPSDEEFDFSHDLFPKMLQQGMNIYGYVTDDYWCDIGDLRSYVRANSDVLLNKVSVQHFDDYVYNDNGIAVSKKAVIEHGTMLFAPCMIGTNTVVKRGTTVGPGTVIGNGCVIDGRSAITNSVLHDNIFVGNNCELKGCIISSDCKLKDNVSVFDGSAIGNNTKIGEMSIIKNSASVWPQKDIESDCTVSENIIWQMAKYSGYFDNERIHGKLNAHITNKMSLTASSAFASGKKRVIAAHNATVAAQMLYSAAKSGIISSGCKLIEAGAIPLPALRYAVRLLSADGAIYTGENDGIADIYFIDENGSNVSRTEARRIALALNNDTVLPVSHDNISEPQSFDKCCEFYESHMIALFNGLNNGKNIKTVNIVSNNSVECDVLINILFKLGVKVNVVDVVTDNIDDKASITVALEDYGEKLIIYDEKGNPKEKSLLNILLNYIVLKSQKGEHLIVADYNSPKAVDIIAKNNNGTVIRTKSGTKALIDEIVKHDLIDDSMSVGKMSMYYDGIAFLIGLIDVLNGEDKSFRELISTLPQLHISEKETECEWSKRCEVLRSLSENKDADPGNGVKITQKYGWSLVLPDEKRAVFKIYSEAFSNEYAEELTDICIRKIKEITAEK